MKIAAAVRKHRMAIVAPFAIFISFANAYAADLVTSSVDTSNRNTLQGYRPAWASDANDLGKVKTDVPMQHLVVVLRRSPEVQQAFEQLITEQQDVSSPHFHQWLTPVEVGERFGASDNDIGVVRAWLTGQGLSVDSISNSRTRIVFSGDAAAVASAFSTELHNYSVNGETRISVATEPQVPAALVSVIHTIGGLYTIKNHAYHVAGSGAMRVSPGKVAQPDATFCGSDPCHYVFPSDFATIYDLNPLYKQGADGTGQTIAVVGRSRVYTPDIENFESLSGLKLKDPITIVPPGGVDPGAAASSGTASGDQSEATLDVTRTTSIAPGAKIDLVVSKATASFDGIYIAAEYVVDTTPVPAHIMSMSFGACEADAGSSGVTLYNDLFSQASMESISVFVCSGDAGAAGCDGYNAAPPASQSKSPNYICSSQYATCVGGTEFADTASPSTYWSSTNSSVYGSALKYIPEGAWNEPVVPNSNAVAYQASATGGGVSTIIGTPTWQTGTGVPVARSGRYTPDVAFSSSQHDGYFGCVAADGNSCVVSGGGFTFEFFAGTSAAAPDMAGITALLDEEMGGPQGVLNSRLYTLAATTSNDVFHDVTVASSGVSGCALTTPSICNNSTPSPTTLTGGLQGFLVGTGFDEATGLGSIDAANLITHWAAKTDLIFRNGFQ